MCIKNIRNCFLYIYYIYITYSLCTNDPETIQKLVNFFCLIFFPLVIFNLLLFCRYNTQWYIAPINIQKMLLFLLQRNTKSLNVILGGIFVASMESAASVRNIPLQYLTKYKLSIYQYKLYKIMKNIF